MIDLSAGGHHEHGRDCRRRQSQQLQPHRVQPGERERRITVALITSVFVSVHIVTSDFVLQDGQMIGALESKVKHAQCFDVALVDDGSVVLASKVQ